MGKEDIWNSIAAHLHGEEIPFSEQQKIKEWMEESPENRGMYYRLYDFYRANASAGPVDPDKAWQKNRQMRRAKSRPGRWLWIGSSAASVILLVGIALWTLYQPSPEATPLQILQTVAQDIQPGSPKATLTLASGKTVDLREDEMTIRESAGMIRNEDHVLEYTAEEKIKQTRLEYNTLDIPRGGEYSLKLEDGTQVWLNADTRLRYPVAFGTRERRVYLEGEAYFQVKKDASRPFIVCMAGVDVTALGTAFNISCDKKARVYTTLVEGAVKVRTTRGTDRILKPSEQAVYAKEGGNLTVQTVKTSLYTSWKDGYYAFERQTLEEIMNTLSRWYDIQVFFINREVGQIRFSGRIKRYENISNLLNLIKLTNDVNFEIKGKTIVVSNGKNRKHS